MAHITTSKTIAAAGDYAAGDVLSENVSTGTAWAFGGVPGAPADVVLYGVRITCSEDLITARFRLHLFESAPTTSELDDNLPLVMTEADRAASLGYVDLPAMADRGDYSEAQVDSIMKEIRASSGGIMYGILETLDAEANESASMVITIDLSVSAERLA